MFLLAVLALLNTVNTTEQSEVKLTKLNKHRVCQGKKPLQEYHILSISSRLKAKLKINESDREHRDLRYHLVRGHWKVRKTGIYFWHPHSRGNPEKGKIDKDYRLV